MISPDKNISPGKTLKSSCDSFLTVFSQLETRIIRIIRVIPAHSAAAALCSRGPKQWALQVGTAFPPREACQVRHRGDATCLGSEARAASKWIWGKSCFKADPRQERLQSGSEAREAWKRIRGKSGFKADPRQELFESGSEASAASKQIQGKSCLKALDPRQEMLEILWSEARGDPRDLSIAWRHWVLGKRGLNQCYPNTAETCRILTGLCSWAQTARSPGPAGQETVWVKNLDCL